MNDYNRIAQAIEYITANIEKQPSLDDIANHINLSPYHFQRLFSQWAGISPKRFLQTLTLKHAKESLNNSESILNASNELGLSSSARLHDHFVSIDAITPGEYKSHGASLKIIYGIHETPFGQVLIATTTRGICHLAFIDVNNSEVAILDLKKKWQAAQLHHSNEETKLIINDIFNPQNKSVKPLSLHVKGTNFQVNVWRALLQVQQGQLCTYGQLARAIDKPNASRAVGTAVGANPIAFLIPCHRVILATGIIGNYRWGNTRKRAILSWEACRQ